MVFLIVLVVAFFVFWALPVRLGGRSVKTAARWAMGAAFVVAGVAHFTMLDTFRAHFPSWMPAVDALVYVTGLIEVGLGLALFARRYQSQVGLLVAAFLLLVFPANVYVAVADVDVPGLPDAWWYAWVRLPFQVLFIWWTLRSTGPHAIPVVSSRAAAAVRATS